MKKVMFLLFNLCFIISFYSFSQERNDEVRQKLQISLDAQSERLTDVPGWSKMENQDGKFWKQSDTNSKISYLPCCPEYGFESLQMFKFTLEGQIFYLFCITYNDHEKRIFAFESSSLQEFQKIINAADGQSHFAIDIKSCDYVTKKFGEEFLFNPEEVIRDKEMIRLLLLGKGQYSTSNYCRGSSLFSINSQVLKGETIVRFNILPWLGTSNDKPQITTENYFELKKVEFEKLFEFTPYENELKYSKQGDEKYNREDYSGAISEYTNAIRLNPNDPSTYNSRGRSKYSLEDYTGAIEDFSRAIELCPKENTYQWNFPIKKEEIARYYLNRAYCKLLLNDYQGVIDDVSNSSEWDRLEGTLFLTAQAHYWLKDYKVALGDFNSLISQVQVWPNGYKEGYNGNYHYWRGMVYLELNDYDKAIIDFSELIKINPESSDGYFNRAYAKDKLKDYSGALSDYNKTIELSPKETISYVKRAALKNKLHDFAGAIADCTKALEIDPEVDIFLYRGVAEIKLGQKDSGCADLKKAVELGSESAKDVLLIYCK